MVRKLSIILVIGLLAFTAACGPKSSSSTVNNPSATASGVAAGATPGTCPTAETKKFAKTLFVADAALAGGAFKRYIYTPAKAGKFAKGAKGKVVALIKAAAAGAFVINRLAAAKTNVENDPALCKVLIAPIAAFSSAVSSLINKAKGGAGTINPSDVTSGDNSLSSLHNAATQGGTAFTDNTNASV
jgi:hypothetical protein